MPTATPDLALTRKRLYEVAGLTVDPDLNRLVFDFVRKLENESLHLERWYDRCSTSSVPRWSVMPGWRSWRRTSSVMRIGGPEMFEENEDDELSDDV